MESEVRIGHRGSIDGCFEMFLTREKRSDRETYVVRGNEAIDALQAFAHVRRLRIKDYPLRKVECYIQHLSTYN